MAYNNKQKLKETLRTSNLPSLIHQIISPWNCIMFSFVCVRQLPKPPKRYFATKCSSSFQNILGVGFGYADRQAHRTPCLCVSSPCHYLTNHVHSLPRQHHGCFAAPSRSLHRFDKPLLDGSCVRGIFKVNP